MSQVLPENGYSQRGVNKKIVNQQIELEVISYHQPKVLTHKVPFSRLHVSRSFGDERSVNHYRTIRFVQCSRSGQRHPPLVTVFKDLYLSHQVTLSEIVLTVW